VTEGRGCARLVGMRHLSPRLPLLLALLLGLCFAAAPLLAQAAVFDGGGLFAGLSEASGIQGVAQGDLLSFIQTLLQRALSYVTLAGVVVVVIAGFILIFSIGDEGMKDKAKRAITYTAIGLLVIYFAEVIVSFFATAGEADIRGPIERLLLGICFYLALAGVVMVVIAGLYLLFSFGDDGAKDKAKLIIYYTLAGLLVIFFARVIVMFVLTLPVVG
jgi:Type IV secretion system pilin